MADSQQQQQRVYQVTNLSPDLIDRVVIDDSPKILFDEFWPFMGVDIPIANIQEHDFKIIRLMARRQILNILERYCEKDWDKIAVIEYELVPKTGADGKIIIDNSNPDKPKAEYERKEVRRYLIVELINSLDAKLYTKLCRAKEGFTLNALTVDRTQIRQDVSDNRPVVMAPPIAQGQASENTGGWGL